MCFSLLLLSYKTRHLLQHFSAGEALHKHLMRETDLISSLLRDEEPEAQRKKMIDSTSRLGCPSSAPTRWVVPYQHPAGVPWINISPQIKKTNLVLQGEDVSTAQLHRCISHCDGWSPFLLRRSIDRKDDLGLGQLIQSGSSSASNPPQVPQSSWVYFPNKQENRRDRKI